MGKSLLWLLTVNMLWFHRMWRIRSGHVTSIASSLLQAQETLPQPTTIPTLAMRCQTTSSGKKHQSQDRG
jgi:hypothetical protein